MPLRSTAGVSWSTETTGGTSSIEARSWATGGHAPGLEPVIELGDDCMSQLDELALDREVASCAIRAHEQVDRIEELPVGFHRGCGAQRRRCVHVRDAGFGQPEAEPCG